MNTFEVYGALYIKHETLSGITVHCFYETYVDYSITSEELGHNNSHTFIHATYKELKKVLKKAGK